MFFKVPNAFDSHCHYLATGQVASGLNLKNLISANHVSLLEIKPHHFQGDWLIGFGWDQNNWPSKEFPDRKILDVIFPNHPVFFSRNDGHASWINTMGMNLLRHRGFDFTRLFSGGKIARDSAGEPTGVLFDQAHIQALQLLPQFTSAQNRNFLQTSQSLFNQGGFTHVRDLSMNFTTWSQLAEMAEKKDLTICIEAFVTIEKLSELSLVLDEVRRMKAMPNSQLRIQGVKLFLDGSLGSKTAYLSKNYLNESSQGMLCWDLEEVRTVMKATWLAGFDFAVHTIGDEAVHQIALTARSISGEAISGRLHLEHVQLIRPETIQLLKPLHVTCHMQPCHWLSDKAWLKNILPADLLSNTFSWEALRKNKIQIQFGSDSPIETPSLIQNFKALQQSSEQGWPKLNTDWTALHSHPDKKWTSSFTEIKDEQIHQVFFNSEPLF